MRSPDPSSADKTERGTRPYRMAARAAVLVTAALLPLTAVTQTQAAPLHAAPAEQARLSIVSFNVLAPIWAAPVWYPATMDPTLLDTAFRRARVIAFLTARAASTDMYCLQEVQDTELRAFLKALGPGFSGFMAVNDRDWWSNWIVPELGWAPNGTAVIVKRSSISATSQLDARLSDGNHAAILEGTLGRGGRPVRIASVHLDSDFNNNRLKESRDVIARLPVASGALDVVCGDLNEDGVNGSAGQTFSAAGFVDVLAAVGNREPTHPFSSSYNRSARWAIIDHVLVRGALPLSGDAIDSGLWAITDEVQRIEENLRVIGSDHFPVVAEVGR
jgi:endonuclease/exonuclease/phosphatase family metal-dependent hydrolase